MKGRNTNAFSAFSELCRHDAQFWSSGLVLAGMDEVGYGSIAGPLVVCCVVLDPSKIHNLRGVYDSKAVSPGKRVRLADRIQAASSRVGYGIALPTDIDKLGLKRALRKAMCSAVHYVVEEESPDFVVIDGSELRSLLPIKHGFIVKGDQKSLTIAASSIMAKVYRDSLMVSYAEKYPEYRFECNKGYGGVAHREAIMRHGPCPIHRYSFSPIRGLWRRSAKSGRAVKL